MKNNRSIFIAILVMIAITALSIAQTIPINSMSGLDITIGGEVEMEFVDVEGPGGFTNQDLTIQKVKNRSPHMRIDKAALAMRVNYSENVFYHIEFRFGDFAANVDKHYLKVNAPSLNTEFKLGKDRPMVSTSRQTEGYPLIGTAYWKGREYQLTAKSEFELLDGIEFSTGLSFAMKRPLGTDDAAEDKSFKMMTYDDHINKDGATFEYGAMAGIDLVGLGLSAQGWYYTGQLIDDFDWKLQLGGLPGYDNVAEAYDDPVGDDLTHFWYGGRVGFDKWNMHLRGEYIGSQDGHLTRDGYYVEGSYRIKAPRFLPVKNIEPIARYGALNVNRHEPLLGDPETWDREMTTLGLITRLNDNISIKIEYYLLDEVTGGDIRTNTEGVTFDDSYVKDNQFLLQIKYEF